MRSANAGRWRGGVLLATILEEGGLAPHGLGWGLYTRRRGAVRFAFNTGPDTADLDARLLASAALAPDTPLLFGSRTLAPAKVAARGGGDDDPEPHRSIRDA